MMAAILMSQRHYPDRDPKVMLDSGMVSVEEAERLVSEKYGEDTVVVAVNVTSKNDVQDVYVLTLVETGEKLNRTDPSHPVSVVKALGETDRKAEKEALGLFLEFFRKTRNLSPAAALMFDAMLTGRWTWSGLATDSDEDLRRLRETTAELAEYIGWVLNTQDWHETFFSQLTPELEEEAAIQLHEDLTAQVGQLDSLIGDGPEKG